MSKKLFPYIFHEINSPLASLQAIAQINSFPIDIKSKIESHITRAHQASFILSNYLNVAETDIDTVIRLITIYTQNNPTISKTKYTWPLPAPTTKTEYQSFTWSLIQKIARLHHASLTKKDSITLLLP